MDFSRPSSSSPFGDLPDHEFWNAHAHSHRSQSLSAPSDSSSSPSLLPSIRSASVAIPPKKLNRKLPPTLTESLENLSRSTTGTSPRASAFDLEKPLPSTPVTTGQYTLAVEPPSIEFGAIHARHTSYRPSTSCTTSTLTSTSTTSMSLRTPPNGSGSILASHPHTPSRPSFSSHASPISCSSGSASTCGTWSVLDEIEIAERAAASRRPRESRKERKARKLAEAEAFDEDTPPSASMLFYASLLEIVDEHGRMVRFGDLVRQRRTIVIFIRHWFCPLCAQYMNSILAEVSLDALEEADVDLIIIGNGSDKMLSAYRNKAFRCPFKMYTDPSLAVYRALGLTRKTGNAGPDDEKGDYLIQTPLESTLQTLKRATIMPLRNPGHFLQLGGEFVFDGTLNVIYTHRMTTTRSHAPIRDICAEAGVRLEFIHYEPGPPPPPVHRSSMILEEDEFDWREERDLQLERMRAMRVARRRGLGDGSEGKKREDERGVVRVVGADGVEEDDLRRRFGDLGVA